jgi:hypothetical protein
MNLFERAMWIIGYMPRPKGDGILVAPHYRKKATRRIPSDEGVDATSSAPLPGQIDMFEPAEKPTDPTMQIDEQYERMRADQ